MGTMDRTETPAGSDWRTGEIGDGGWYDELRVQSADPDDVAMYATAYRHGPSGRVTVEASAHRADLLAVTSARRLCGDGLYMVQAEDARRLSVLKLYTDEPVGLARVLRSLADQIDAAVAEAEAADRSA